MQRQPCEEYKHWSRCYNGDGPLPPGPGRRIETLETIELTAGQKRQMQNINKGMDQAQADMAALKKLQQVMTKKYEPYLAVLGKSNASTVIKLTNNVMNKFWADECVMDDDGRKLMLIEKAKFEMDPANYLKEFGVCLENHVLSNIKEERYPLEWIPIDLMGVLAPEHLSNPRIQEANKIGSFMKLLGHSGTPDTTVSKFMYSCTMSTVVEEMTYTSNYDIGIGLNYKVTGIGDTKVKAFNQGMDKLNGIDSTQNQPTSE